MNPARHPATSPTDPPPQMDRALNLMSEMRSEYDTALTENKSLVVMRRDFHRKFEEQLRELEQVERHLVDLEAAHTKCKADADAEISRLKSQLSHRPSPGPADTADNNSGLNRPNGLPVSIPAPTNPSHPSNTLPQDPARSLPPTLPPPTLSAVPHTTGDPQPPPPQQQQPHQPQQQPPYNTPIQSFGTSRQMYPSNHPSLPQHLNPYSQYTQSHPDSAQHHPAKFPRLAGPSTHPHHIQVGHNSSGPLPSLPGNPRNPIPPIMSNGVTPTSRVEVPAMGMMSNGPHDDRLKTAVQRSLPSRANPGMLGRRSTAVTPGGRARQSNMNPADDGVRMAATDDDWHVEKGRGADGALVNIDLNLQHSLPHDSVVCCVRYSWDGRLLATGSNRSAHIFDANTGQRVAKLAESGGMGDGEDGGGNDSYVRAVCFSPNGEWLITGAEDHIVKVWDVRNSMVKHRLVGHTTDIYSVDASQNSRFIISGSGDKRAKLWNLETGKELSTLGGEYGPTDGITSVSVSPTNQHVAAGSLDKIVRVWDVESTHMVRQFEGHQDSVYSVAFSPDGRLLLSGSLDKTLKLWDLSVPQQSAQCRLSFTGHNDFVLSVAFSPSGQWLISGSKDRTVRFWDPRQPTTCLTLQGHKNSVISIAHNPVSNHLATGSGDCRARTWLYQY